MDKKKSNQDFTLGFMFEYDKILKYPTRGTIIEI